MAFRWSGVVQRIHHVDAYRIVDGLKTDFPNIPATPDTERQHLLYDLGSESAQTRPLPNGQGMHLQGRLWVALDLLLTCATLREALDATKERTAHA